MASARAITYIAAGVLLIVVVGAVVVLLAEGRAPPTFPAGSPQAAMQSYLAAWEERDLEAAYAYFSAEIKADTSLEEYRRAANGFADVSPGEEAVFIDAAEGSGDSTTLHLTIEHYSGGPGSDVFRTTSTVRMVREADGWKIDEPLLGAESAPFPFDESPL